MRNYWFRICFEKEFKNDEEAENFLDNEVIPDVYQNDVKELSQEFEERKKAKKQKTEELSK